MLTKFIEVTQGVEEGFNYGKFMVARFSQEEWDRRSEMDQAYGLDRSLLARCGWTADHVLVFDLQTGEGAFLSPGGSARADLDKHRVWVCPMFEPFLEWMYEWFGSFKEHERPDDAMSRDVASQWFDALPSLVELPNAPAAMAGYRREGSGG